MTARGLRIPAPMTKRESFSTLSLNCWRMQEEKSMAVVLLLSNTGGYRKRIRCNKMAWRPSVKCTPWPVAYTPQIYIPQRNIVTHRLIDGY